HIAAGEELTALGIVDAAFEQRLTDALRESAVHLSFDDHRIHDAAEIVDGGETHDARLPGLPVDLDLADVRAGGEREIRRIVERGLVETRLELVERIVMRNVRRERDFAEGFTAIARVERAVPELDVVLGSFEEIRGDPAPLLA